MTNNSGELGVAFVNEKAGTKDVLENIAEVFSKKWNERDKSNPKLMLGFNPLSIEPEQVGIITKRGQLAFQPDYLLIPSSIAEFFQIIDIKIGPYSQFICSQEIPGSMFSENAPINRMEFDTCPVSTPVTIRIRNTDNRPHVFAAVIVGRPIRIDSLEGIGVDNVTYFWKFFENSNELTIYPVGIDIHSCSVVAPRNFSSMTEDDKKCFVREQIKKYIPVCTRVPIDQLDELHRKSSGPIK